MIYKKINLHIDTVSYKNKETAKKNYGKIKTRLQQDSLPTKVAVKEIAEVLQKGRTISPAVMSGTKAEDFIEQQLFMVDIDNKNTDIPLLKIEDALDICKKNHLQPVFYYYTFSHTAKIPKFRLAFVMNEIVKDNTIRLMIIQSVISLFEQADESCTNADRIFLGTNKEVVICDLEARITVDNVLDIASKSITEKKDISIETDSELDKLKKEFDFFSYLKKRKKNGKVKSENSRYAMFEKCEICGHKDDLVYFKDTNSFYCFGASGKIGGSIIDYLIITEELSLKEAINKLKYELCGLKKEKKVIHSITAKELATMKLPELYVVVKNLLEQGLCVLAGQRKLGKSWMILNLCYCVCTGQPFLSFETNKSACFYLSLEDSEPRLQDRMKKVFGDKDIPTNLHFATKCEPLDNGLIEQLENKLKEYPDIKLIVIDTLQKVRSVQTRNQNAYDYDYKDLGKLKEFADKHKICILVVHHLRKMKDYDDPFNNISGSTGIPSVADTTILLYKDKIADVNTNFMTQSRDFEEIQKTLFFNDFKWNVIDDFGDFGKEIEKISYKTDPIVITINKLLEENPEGIKISSDELYKKIIETTKSKPRQKSSNALTRHINETLQFNLLAFDGIYYEAPSKNGGSSGRKMYFSKPKKDI